MLQVVIHDDDDSSACRAQPGHDGVVLTGVRTKVDTAHGRISFASLLDLRPGAVPAAVVDQDHLVRAGSGPRSHGFHQAPCKLGHKPLAVVDRYDDREIHLYALPCRRNTSNLRSANDSIAVGAAAIR